MSRCPALGSEGKGQDWCLVSRVRYLFISPAPDTYLRIAAVLCFVSIFHISRAYYAAKMVIEKLLPFGFFSPGTTCQELVGLLTSNTTHFPPLFSRRIEQLLVEKQVAKEKVSGSWFIGDTSGFVVVYYDTYTILGSLLSPLMSLKRKIQGTHIKSVRFFLPIKLQHTRCPCRFYSSLHSSYL